METYEEFCSRSLARVSAESEVHSCSTASTQQEVPHSLIRFHGMTALAPLLNEEQRRDMVQYRLRAMQLDSHRRNRHREVLLARVRDILDQVQVRKTSKGSETLAPSAGCPLEHQSTNGFSILPDASTPPCRVREGEDVVDDGEGFDLKDKSTVHLIRSDGGAAVEECNCQEQNGKNTPVCQGSCKATPLPEDSLSNKENETSGIGDESGGHGGGASLMTAPPPHGPSSTVHCQISPGASLDSLLGCLPHSLTGSYAQLPTPQPSLSPLPHRQRLRPVSTGNILIANPTNAAELSPPRAHKCGPVRNSSSPPDGSLHSSQMSSRVNPPASSPCDDHKGSPTLISCMDPRVDTDCSQERIPRFLSDQPWRPQLRRSPPAPLNKSYDVECPSPTLLRPHVVSDPSISPTDTHHQSLLRLFMKEQSGATDELQQRLQEDHTHWLSLLKAEPKKEQHQCLLQEKNQNCAPLTLICPDNKSPGQSAHGKSTPSHGSAHVVSPHLQSPVYWAPSPGTSKIHSRLTLVETPKQQKGLYRLSALVRGFLTRRLLRTEKVKYLCQTVKDTQDFIRSFQNDIPGKKAALSAQDLSLQDRVRAQLRAALFSIHDIFFTWGSGERMALLQQDRELQADRKLREMEKAKSPRNPVTLSAATQKSLHRKKQRMIDTSGQGKRPPPKPKPKVPAKSSCIPQKRLSAPHVPVVPSRVLQPSQGQNALPSGQLLRQGSLYRKNPEERVKRFHNLRNQHSLG